MHTQLISRKQVIELAKEMPLEKLGNWYEYGLFIQARPLTVSTGKVGEGDESLLAQEFVAWETASDEDWLNFEDSLATEG